MGEITTTVEIDGEQREVNVDPSEHGFISEDEIGDRYVPRAQHRAERDKARRKAREEARSELAADEEFLQTVATEREDFFRERFGDAESEGPDIEKVREQLRSEEVEPLQSELSEREEEIQRLRRDRLRGEVARACADLPVKPNLRPLIESFYEGRVAWSDQYGGWFVTDESGEFQYAQDPEDSEAPYRTIEEDLALRHRSGDYQGDWFDENGRPGADVGSPGSGGRSGRVTLEEFKQMSSTERRQLKDQNYDRWKELQDERSQEGMEALTSAGSGL